MDESTEHYETVAYWYGLPSPSLVETDHLRIGDTGAKFCFNQLEVGADKLQVEHTLSV